MSDLSGDDSSLSDFAMFSDEEGDFFLLEERVKPKNENYCEITIPRYSEAEFIEHFRISRRVAENLEEQFRISHYFHYQSGGNGKLSAYKQFLIYLWFAGHQTASFHDVADRFHIAIGTLAKLLTRITYFLSNLSTQTITWPDNNEKHEIQQHFREQNFSGVIGIIDGTHIKIDKPANDPDSYLNRKHFFCIQLQVACDHRRKIRDIFVGFPGSVHDSRVFRTFPLAGTLQNKCADLYILGDSGYPCLPNLLTVFKGNLTRQQHNYNQKLAKNRYIIEHCFGILKQKFKQLYHIKLRNIKTIVHFIRACCVLHNLALDDNFIEYEELERQYDVAESVIDNEEGEDARGDRNAVQIRNRVANILPL